MSFRLKLLIGAGAIQALLLTIYVAGSMVWHLHLSKEEMRTEAKMLAEAGRMALMDAVLSYDFATMDAVLAAMASSPLVDHVALLDPLMLPMAEAGTVPPDLPGALRAAAAEGGGVLNVDGAMEALHPIDGPGGPVAWLRVRLPLAPYEARIWDHLQADAAAAAAGFVALLAAVHLLAGTLSRRILLLREGADRILEGDLAHRLPDGGGDEIGRCIDGFNEMLDALAEERERLDRRLVSDPLTGVANRVGLRRHLDACGTDPACHGLAVLQVDLDRFKLINDTRGHAAGDVVLAAVAARLRERSPGAALVARVGGDEFVVAAPDQSDAALQELAEDLIMALCEPVEHAGERLSVGASIGVARLAGGAGAGAAETALMNADIALYASKEAGRGRATLFDDGMRAEMERNARLVEEVRRGVEMGDFLPVLQPQARLSDGTPVAVAALARWRRPEKGLAAPARFIEAIGDGPLLARIDEMVRDKACAWLARRRAARPDAPPLRLGFAVTAGQLRDERTPRLLMRLAERHGLSPADLLLELGRLPPCRDGTGPEAAALRTLSRLGFRLSFAAGVDERALMELTPGGAPCQVRIERRLLDGAAEDRIKRRYLKATVQAHRALGNTLLARGVETEAEIALLRELGVDVVQGYAVARPAPGDAVSDWLDARAAESPGESAGEAAALRRM